MISTKLVRVGGSVDGDCYVGRHWSWMYNITGFFSKYAGFSSEFWRKIRYFFLRETSPGAPGRIGIFAEARRAALESSRCRRCTRGRRAMSALKPMCRQRARQCHGTGESRNLSFKFKLEVISVITLKFIMIYVLQIIFVCFVDLRIVPFFSPARPQMSTGSGSNPLGRRRH